MRRAFQNGIDTTATMLALLNGGMWFPIDLLQVTLRELGVPTRLVLRYSLADVGVTFEGQRWAADGPRVSRGTIRVAVGTEVDTLGLTIGATLADTLPPADAAHPTEVWPLIASITKGMWTDADVVLRRLLLPSVPTFGAAIDTSAGAITLFGGRVRGWDLRRGQALLEVRSYMDHLDVTLPRNIYQAQCLNSLYDPVCGASPEGDFAGIAFAATGSVAALSTATSIGVLPPPTQPPTYFELGSLQLLSGKMAGLRRTVKTSFPGGGFTLQQPFPEAPPAGVAVRLQAGCDKRRTTCETKFGNLPRFRGFPYIPPADNAI